MGPVVGFDASTTGGGAWLLPQVGKCLYLFTRWTSLDEELLNVRVGDPAAQAIWEAFSLLIAINTWKHVLAQRSGTLELRGDAEGVLKAVLQRRAKAPVVNLIVAEMQLVLGQTMFDMFAAHVWSEENVVADLLSRQAEGAPFPDQLLSAAKWNAKRGPWALLGSGQ